MWKQWLCKWRDKSYDRRQRRDEESDDVSYDLDFHHNEAIKNLSATFRSLIIDSIHES